MPITPYAPDPRKFQFNWTANTDDDFRAYEIKDYSGNIIATFSTQSTNTYFWDNNADNIDYLGYKITVSNNGDTTDSNYPFYTESDWAIGRRPKIVSVSTVTVIPDETDVWAETEFVIVGSATPTNSTPVFLYSNFGDNVTDLSPVSTLTLIYNTYHRYTIDDSYIPSFQLVDEAGFFSNGTTTSITVNTLDPVPDIEVSPLIGGTTDTFYFNMSKSYPRPADATISEYKASIYQNGTFIGDEISASGVISYTTDVVATYTICATITDSNASVGTDSANYVTFTVQSLTATALSLPNTQINIVGRSRERNKIENSKLYGEGENLIDIGSTNYRLSLEGRTAIPKGYADMVELTDAADSDLYVSITVVDMGVSTTYSGYLTNFDDRFVGGEPGSKYWTAELIVPV